MKLLFVSGSLRKNSFNKQLAEIAASELLQKAEISFLDYHNVPLFNQDEEFPTPQSIQQVRKACQEADGIWFFTPEYNQEIPGVLKNLLDWLSRPMEKGTRYFNTAIFGKPATVSSVGGKTRAIPAFEQLEMLLKALGMKVMAEPAANIGLDRDAFASDSISEEEKEEMKKEALEQGLAFIAFIEQNQKKPN